MGVPIIKNWNDALAVVTNNYIVGKVLFEHVVKKKSRYYII